MARVERGNVVLRVKDEEVQRYLLLGYNLTDESGRVIKEAIPTDFATLQRFYVEQTGKVAELEDRIAKLTAELMQYKEQAKAKTSVSDTTEDKPAKAPAKSTKKSSKA